MESHEPLKLISVIDNVERHAVAPTPVEWSEEERRNVVVFFTLLDQWDRQLSEKKGAA
jgi:hypothetical protein